TTAEAPVGDGLLKLVGVTVSVHGARARVFYVSPSQINFQLPWNLTPGPVAITVFVNGAPSNTVVALATNYAPGIFAVTHEDGQLVSPESAARPGETVVLWATGLGPFRAGSTEERDVAVPPDVLLGEQPAEVELARGTTGFAGLYHVWIRIPPDVLLGAALTLELSVGGRATTIPLAVSR
ncbi:MAG: hypothetical protein ACPL88_13065, partial [Bryobacteraceae bacterium]